MITFGVAITEEGTARETHVEVVMTVTARILSHKAILVFPVIDLRNYLITEMNKVRDTLFITGAMEQTWKGEG
jgi:hypothetical protein